MAPGQPLPGSGCAPGVVQNETIALLMTGAAALQVEVVPGPITIGMCLAIISLTACTATSETTFASAHGAEVLDTPAHEPVGRLTFVNVAPVSVERNSPLLVAT